MAEEKSTKTTRKKTTTTVSNDDISTLILQMQEEIATLKKELKDSKAQTTNVTKEKSDLEQLVTMLQSQSNGGKQLSKKVKVMSLIPNKLNLTTEKDGRGKQFTFESFGDIVTMKTTELEDILSIQRYREQAEEGLFYILDKDIVEDQELADAYANMYDKKGIEDIILLRTDECVDAFCNLGEQMQESLAIYMAEKLNLGERIDRNRISDISMRADIDISKIAENLKKTKK